MQLPIGAEENFEGVIDLLTMKAYKFEGNMGEDRDRVRDPREPTKPSEAKKYRAELVESIVEHDDALMTATSTAKSRSLESSRQTLRKAVIANKIFPVYTGSALKNKGVQLVLDAVVDYLPSPARHAAGYRHQPKDRRAY
jgi:elongation factor G